ncbi:MAG: hypothetical protein LBH84_03200 [Prevotellaceae bacterium]|nr:hypothetical protein [Prevotellaceae bacterium]
MDNRTEQEMNVTLDVGGATVKRLKVRTTADKIGKRCCPAPLPAARSTSVNSQ